MNAIDFIILGVFILAAIVGWTKGLIGQAGTIAGIILAVVVCRFFGGTVADMIVSPGSEHAELYRVLVYALTFAVTYLVVKLVASLCTKALNAIHLSIINRVGGVLFSVGAWLLILSIVLNVYLAVAPADIDKFNDPAKPWRTAVARCAPALMGYLQTRQAS